MRTKRSKDTWEQCVRMHHNCQEEALTFKDKKWRPEICPSAWTPTIEGSGAPCKNWMACTPSIEGFGVSIPGCLGRGSSWDLRDYPVAPVPRCRRRLRQCLKSGNMEVWESGNLEIWASGKLHIYPTKIKACIRHAQQVGKVLISRRKALLNLFGNIFGKAFHRTNQC